MADILSMNDIEGKFAEEKQDKEYLEVLFPNKFTQWPNKPGFSTKYGPETIPIFQLAHITHEKEADGIVASNYTFAPKMKLGKELRPGSSAYGETYKQTDDSSFQKIPRSFDNPVFPGYLSWWGIDIRSWYKEENGEGEKLCAKIAGHHEGKRYAPSYLQAVTGSPYGNKAFSMNLEQILRNYQASRQERQVCLKVGGTLRYRYEICYVVIVCTQDDNLPQDPLTNNDQVDFRGLVDENGVVVKYSHTPYFTVKSIVKSVYPGAHHYNWEQLAFAFYYPAPMLQCTMTEEPSDVLHHKPSPPAPQCILSRCPN